MSQQVSVHGPNIGHGGEFRIHRLGCADTKRGEYLRTEPPWSIEATSEQQVVEEIYSDILAENPESTWESYAETVRFFPCLDLLPRTCRRCGSPTRGFRPGVATEEGGDLCRTCASVAGVGARLAQTAQAPSAGYVDEIQRAGVTATRTWSADPATDPYAYVVDQRCVACGTQVTDDDRGPLYNSDTDDGTAHRCPEKGAAVAS